MGEQGAALQTYNQELVKCVEGMKLKLDVVNDAIKKDEVERCSLEEQLAAVSLQLDSVRSKLKKKQETRSNLEETLKKTEAAYTKILESSQVLLSMVKNETELIDEI